MTSQPAQSSRGFVFLNVTQFFGAANDNILKQIVIFGVATGGLWSDQLGKGAQGYASLALAIPFVLFSGFAGQFSDRFSKRDVSVVVKLSEIVIAILACIGLAMANLWLVLSALILISIQSAFFSPAKFGILPEIMKETELSRANGTINMFTYVAIILGGALGGPLYEAYTGEEPLLWLPGVIVLVVAVVGTLGSFGIPKLAAKNPTQPIRFVVFKSYVEAWRGISGQPLASVMVAWSYFYMIVAGIAILIIPDYTELLEINHTMTALLMALLGISIGVGDFVAGRVSGHQIRPSLIPIGAIGTTVMFFVLGVIPHNFVLVTVCLALAGFSAGFFMVPLQAMTQQLSAEEERGRILALWNCGSFVGVICGNLLFIAVKQTGIASDKVFLICGVLGLICVALYQFHWRKIFADAVAESQTH